MSFSILFTNHNHDAKPGSTSVPLIKIKTSSSPSSLSSLFANMAKSDAPAPATPVVPAASTASCGVGDDVIHDAFGPHIRIPSSGGGRTTFLARYAGSIADDSSSIISTTSTNGCGFSFWQYPPRRMLRPITAAAHPFIAAWDCDSDGGGGDNGDNGDNKAFRQQLLQLL